MAVTMSVGLLILRIVVGLTLAVHGTQKLFGWFAGPGLARLKVGFEKQGYYPILIIADQATEMLPSFL
jgi:putative oxidoreductase